MSKKFDLEKVNAALKQAAKTAISGTALERSGRLLASAGTANTRTKPPKRA
ncbi:MAG: hypothetical protein ABL883_00330 [Terricaulis sp.]